MKVQFEAFNASIGTLMSEHYKHGYIDGWDDGRKKGYDEALSDITEN